MNFDPLTDLSGLQASSLRRAYYELGKSLIRAGEMSRAEESLRQALQSTDETVEDWEIYRLLSKINKEKSESGLAHSFLLQAIATAPADIAEELTKGLSAVDQQPMTDGNTTNILDKVLLLQGEAEVLRKQDSYDAARDKISEAIALAEKNNDPDKLLSCRLTLAKIEYESGRFTELEQQLVLVGKPGNTQPDFAVRLLKGKSLLTQNKHQESLLLADEMIAETNSIDAHVLKLQCLIYASRYNEALETVHKALISNPVADDLLFYKMEVLIEGNINREEAFDIFQDLKRRKGIDFICDKLKDPYIRFRTHHGNDNFFIAQLYLWMPERFSHEQLLAEADKAIAEVVNVKDMQYPHGIVYRLKAEAYEGMKDNANAAIFYHAAGKEFYWNRQYTIAAPLYHRAMELDPALIDNYRYYADNQLMLSFTSEYPFVDENYVADARSLWTAGYQRRIPVRADAWTYLTLARIHEQRALLKNVVKADEYESAWLAVERNLLLDDRGYLAWTFLSRVLRQTEGAEISSYYAAKKAEQLNADTSAVWEEVSAICLNLARWEEGLANLRKLSAEFPSEYVYKGWEGFAMYNQLQYAKAIEAFSQAINASPSWVWARYLRVICYWFLDKKEELKEDVSYILSRKTTYLENHAYWEVAFSLFAIGEVREANAVCEVAQNIKEYEKNSHFYQCIFKLSVGNRAEAEAHLDKYLALASIERDVMEMGDFIKKLTPGNDAMLARLSPKLNEIQDKQRGLAPITELNELEKNNEEYNDQNTDAWLAIRLAYFRTYQDEKDWMKALEYAREIRGTRKDFYIDALQMYLNLIFNIQTWLAGFIENGKEFNEWKKITDVMGGICLDIPGFSKTAAESKEPFSEDIIKALQKLDEQFLSIPDTYVILALYAKNIGDTDLHERLRDVANILYPSFGNPGIDENMGRIKEQYPVVKTILSRNLSEENIVVETRCQHCGAEITSSKQRFCYSCGNVVNQYSSFYKTQ